jgi:hypothetical protein
MPSIYIDPTPKKLQEVIQQDFLIVPTNRRGDNRFKRGSFQKSTWNASGKSNVKHLGTSDPIQVSSDIESPTKGLGKCLQKNWSLIEKKKSEPISPHKPLVTPTSQMPTSDPKTDRLSTSFKGSNPSSEISDHNPTIEKLQQENVQLLQQLEERKTMDRHLHHDNAILQEKVNSLQ